MQLDEKSSCCALATTASLQPRPDHALLGESPGGSGTINAQGSAYPFPREVPIRLRLASLVQCFANSAGDLRRLLVSVELHDPPEALRASDENAQAAAEGISCDPGLVTNRQLLAARFDCGLDPLASVGGYAVGVEDGQRHW
jgi:hypothetical protein